MRPSCTASITIRLKAAHTVISNASCTTNCLAPLVKALNDRIGVVNGLMTTIHAYTNDQVLTDVYHTDLRRARSATMSMIPTKTGAAAAVGLVLPELNGKLDGFAIRVPTINVSLVDLAFVAKRATTVDEVNNAVKQASESDLKGILEYNKDPLVSVDFNHNPASSVFRLDAHQGFGRNAGEGMLLVRQRMGFQQPDARYHGCVDEREISRTHLPQRAQRRTTAMTCHGPLFLCALSRSLWRKGVELRP